ncbi:hypothetical protein [Qipengyuania oceanensis]|uniref:hypothetical protein n=1 Tax=Qipengyuania oceanensis TaxID=1463597 RepID=UPI001F234980|nr:hypothetical protein [Qipengyuania oceanensis]
MFTQLHTPLPVHVLGKGAGLAFAVIDYGVEHNLLWVTALSDGGEIWCVPNPQVRMAENWSMARSRDNAAEQPGRTIMPASDEPNDDESDKRL